MVPVGQMATGPPPPKIWFGKRKNRATPPPVVSGFSPCLKRLYRFSKAGKIVERPQHMLMRCACGIHCGDVQAALQTYDLMSRRFVFFAPQQLCLAFLWHFFHIFSRVGVVLGELPESQGSSFFCVLQGEQFLMGYKL